MLSDEDPYGRLVLDMCVKLVILAVVGAALSQLIN
jgi:hypothetical protein